MTELTTKARNALPDGAFGLPAERAYPMPDAPMREMPRRALLKSSTGVL